MLLLGYNATLVSAHEVALGEAACSALGSAVKYLCFGADSGDRCGHVFSNFVREKN